MKSILERISEKSSFKEIQLFLKQTECCSRSPRHDYNKYIPIFSHITELKRINFRTEFSDKLSASQIHTLQRLCLDIKLIANTTTVGMYDVLATRFDVTDFRDLVDLFYMKQNEKQQQYMRTDDSDLPPEALNSDDGIGVSCGKRKYTRKVKQSEFKDENNTVVLGKTHLHKLFDMVYYFEEKTLTIWYCKITGMSYETLRLDMPETESGVGLKNNVIMLRLECPSEDFQTSGVVKILPNIKASEVRLSEDAIKDYIWSKIKINK